MDSRTDQQQQHHQQQVSNMTTTTTLNNLFVKCPDGQTICLTNLNPAVETPSSIKRHVAQKWNPATSNTNTRYESLAALTLLAHFLAMIGVMAKLEDELYLTYEGKLLRDGTGTSSSGAASGVSLAHYNIPNSNATIHASVRVRGGCFMASLSLLCVIVGAMMMSIFTCGGSLFIIPFLAPFLFILPFFCL